jgi:hypothetical protein
MRLHGVDFTSAPSKRKAITIASGVLRSGVLCLDSLQSLTSFAAFDAWLKHDGPWLAGFDLPFSLPRELLTHLHWPQEWSALMRHLTTVTRAEMRLQFKAFAMPAPWVQVRAPGDRYSGRLVALDEMGQSAGRVYVARGCAALAGRRGQHSRHDCR